MGILSFRRTGKFVFQYFTQVLALYLCFEGVKNIWGFEGSRKFLAWVWHLDYDFDVVACIWYTNDTNFGCQSWFWRCKEQSCPLSPHLRIWRMLEVPDWGLASWSLFRFFNWSMIHPCSYLGLSILVLKVQRTSLSFKSLFRALEDAGCSWLGFSILIFIWIWSLVFDTPMIRILALYLDFEGAKNIHVL